MCTKKIKENTAYQPYQKKKKKNIWCISYALPKKYLQILAYPPKNSPCFHFIKVWLSIYFSFIMIVLISNISALNSFQKQLRFYFNGTELIHSRNRAVFLFVCVEVLRPCQPSGIMSSAVSLPNHTFTGQA